MTKRIAKTYDQKFQSQAVKSAQELRVFQQLCDRQFYCTTSY